MDISDTLQAKSDQLNSDDLIGGPQLFTVEKVARGADEQPVNIHLVENPGHPYRPSKSMRRVLVAIWGKEASRWDGRQFVLYRDPQVRFGGEVVGGIKISHASHIDGPQSIPLTVKRGQKARHTVDPLREAAPVPTPPANPERDTLLAEIKTAAEKAGVALADVAAEWSASHEGQNIREASDIGGLELLRDDLSARAES